MGITSCLHSNMTFSVLSLCATQKIMYNYFSLPSIVSFTGKIIYGHLPYTQWVTCCHSKPISVHTMPVLMAGEKIGFALLISISLFIEILPTHINVLIIGFLFVCFSIEEQPSHLSQYFFFFLRISDFSFVIQFSIRRYARFSSKYHNLFHIFKLIGFAF